MDPLAGAHRTIVDRDIPYLDHDEQTFTLDTYRPEERTESPAILYIHGGAWMVGSKGQFSRYALEFADRGYVGVNPDYRLAPQVTVWEMVADIRESIAWTREHADELGVDPDRIALAGHSSGAHLAALTALTLPEDEAVQAVLGFSGNYDLRFPEADIFPRLVDAEDLDSALAEASPITMVDGECPPTFLAHAEDDGTVPVSQSDDFRDALESHDQSVDYFRPPEGDHVFLYDDTGWYEQTVERMADFLDTHL